MGRRKLCAASAVGPDSGHILMAANDWLSERRTEVAADRILDAAEELFTRHDPGSVGMNEIAKAAGCSRATLYRYFENREALRTAYVNRETYRLFDAIKEQDQRHYRPTRTTQRRHRHHPSPGPGKPRAGVVVCHHAAADRW